MLTSLYLRNMVCGGDDQYDNNPLSNEFGLAGDPAINTITIKPLSKECG